ncbi:hypothetical protein IHE45_04G070600 [Dioscorea alata]|uniref:Uncharacterized protein n=1 Tax=Dioscorea alata TaxID=55571 RepID=A0ACB7WCT0_DIOAL|nr:hypothetical protein IHE45_04G070600 [Dioscorea alata]
MPDGSSQVINTHQHRQQGRQVPSRYLRDLFQDGSKTQKKRKVPQLFAKALLANKREKPRVHMKRKITTREVVHIAVFLNVIM